MHAPSKKAFTLIELSIALVIIGLLVGGILVGRELIIGAQVRAQVAQLQKLSTAESTFKLKYNCKAGDCGTASSAGIGTNGNGNGELENWDLPAIGLKNVDGSELQNFWSHLSAANLIAETYPLGAVPGTNSPSLKLAGKDTGGIWLSDSYIVTPNPVDRRHKPAWLLISHTQNIPFTPNSIYSHAQAFAIDSKLDDGYPMQGLVIAMNGWAANSCNPLDDYCVSQAASTSGVPPYTAGAATSCIDDSSGAARYNMANDECTNITDHTCLCGLVLYTRP